MITHSIAFCVLAALFPVASAALAPQSSASLACDSTARALLNSARSEAEAQFWRRLAAGGSEPVHSMREVLQHALRERTEARGLADQQNLARLEFCALFGGVNYAPVIVPSEFSSRVDHPFFPLVPGRTLVYERQLSDGLERVEKRTLATEAEILGVRCRPVELVKTVEGTLVERSTNWFSQHKDGSVWWFGELTQHYEDGFLSSLSESWRAGVNGAQPGIHVPSSLGIGVPFRRALALGCAEDVGTISSLRARVRVPAGEFTGALVIEERDALEPLELIVEILVAGLGLVAETESATGLRLELVEVLEESPK